MCNTLYRNRTNKHRTYSAVTKIICPQHLINAKSVKTKKLNKNLNISFSVTHYFIMVEIIMVYRNIGIFFFCFIIPGLFSSVDDFFNGHLLCEPKIEIFFCSEISKLFSAIKPKFYGRLIRNYYAQKMKQ